MGNQLHTPQHARDGVDIEPDELRTTLDLGVRLRLLSDSIAQHELAWMRL